VADTYINRTNRTAKLPARERSAPEDESVFWFTITFWGYGSC